MNNLLVHILKVASMLVAINSFSQAPNLISVLTNFQKEQETLHNNTQEAEACIYEKRCRLIKNAEKALKETFDGAAKSYCSALKSLIYQEKCWIEYYEICLDMQKELIPNVLTRMHNLLCIFNNSVRGKVAEGTHAAFIREKQLLLRKKITDLGLLINNSSSTENGEMDFHPLAELKQCNDIKRRYTNHQGEKESSLISILTEAMDLLQKINDKITINQQEDPILTYCQNTINYSIEGIFVKLRTQLPESKKSEEIPSFENLCEHIGEAFSQKISAINVSTDFSLAKDPMTL